MRKHLRNPEIPSTEAAPSNRENGFILFSLLIIGTLIMCMALSTMLGMKHSIRTAGTYRVKDNTFNIAEAGKEHFLALLRLDSVGLKPNNDSIYLNNTSFDVGYYSVRCVTNAALDTLIVRSYGTAGTQTAAVEAVCHRYYPTMNQVKAAVTSRRSDTITGNIKIDGRDWDSTNFDTIGAGVLGIYTCDTVTIDAAGSSAIGGMGIEPPSPKGVAPGSVQVHGDAASFPGDPESVLGVDSGALDKYRTLPPASVFYTGTNNVVYWDSCPQATVSLSGGGVIICHNAAYSAVLRNVHGSFKGIIIADRIDKVNAGMLFLGAIFTLSTNPSGNVFGNGSPKIRYSSRIVNKALKLILHPTVDVVSWKEL